MKKVYSLFLLIFIVSLHSRAQTSIASADLPHANDTFRVSIGQITAGINATATGPAFNWDFTQLQPTTQRVDSFIDESATSSIFSIIFIDNAFNTNRANQATKASGFNLGTTISLTGVFNFYYNSNASYKQVGFGANVNGIPLPVTYSPHDIIYKLPLQYPSLDSSASGYAVDLASTIGVYYKANRTRKNEVDGWGSLTTSFGTFDVLRVHSTIVQKDSLYLDTLGFGFNLPAVTTHEYKWLGNLQGIPLLQINTSAGGVITQIIYKDSIRSLVGVDEIEAINQSLKVFPNPASSSATISYELNKFSVVDIDIISLDGKIIEGIKSQSQSPGVHELHLNFLEKKIASGKYLIRLTVNGDSFIQPLMLSAFR